MIKKYSLDHFVISMILPPMVRHYYFREIKPIAPKLHALQDERGKPRFEGEELKRRVKKRLWGKRDFTMAVYGAGAGTVGYIGGLVWYFL